MSFEENIIKMAQYFLYNSELELSWMLYHSSNRDYGIRNLKLLFNGDINTIYPASERIPSNLSLKWIISSFLSRLGFINSDFIQIMPLYLIQEVNSAVYKLIVDINTQEEFQFEAKHQKLFISFLKWMSENNISMAYSIREYLDPVIQIIKPETILASIGINGLHFMISPPIDYFAKSSMRIIDFGSVFSFPINYESPELSRIIQSRICGSFVYPNPFPNVENGYFFSLTNSAIKKELHFVDILSNVLFSNGPDLVIKEPDFIELIPWIYISKIRSYIGNRKAIEELHFQLKKKYQKGIVQNTIKRLLNDIRLLCSLSSILQRTVSSSELKSSSVPKLLSDKIFDDKIFDFQKLKYFIIDDESKRIDFDFLSGYFVLYSLVAVMRTNIDKNNKVLQMIKQVLARVSNIDLRLSIEKDMFSLVFLQDSSGYICSYRLAREITHILEDSINNKYYNELSLALKYTHFRSASETIERAIIGKESLFYKMLGKHYYEHAFSISKENSFLHMIYHRSRSLYESSIINTDSALVSDPMVFVESFFQNKYNAIPIEITRTLLDEIIVLSNTRKEKGTDLLLFRDKNLTKESDIMSSSYHRNSTDKLTSSFLKFHMFIEANHFESIESFLFSLATSNSTKEIENIEGVLDINIFYYIIQKYEGRAFSSVFLQYFQSKYPYEVLFLIMDSEPCPISEIDFGGKSVNSFINRKLSQNKHDSCTLQYDNGILNRMSYIDSKYNGNPPLVVLLELFADLMRLDDLCIGILDDILYKIDIEELSKDIETNYNEYRIKQLFHLSKLDILPSKMEIIKRVMSVVKVDGNPTYYSFSQSIPYDKQIEYLVSGTPINECIDYIQYIDKKSLDIILNSQHFNEKILYQLLKQFPSLYGSLFCTLKNDLKYIPIFMSFQTGSYYTLFRILNIFGADEVISKCVDFSTSSISWCLKLFFSQCNNLSMIGELKKRFGVCLESFPELINEITTMISDVIIGIISSYEIDSFYKEIHFLIFLSKVIELTLPSNIISQFGIVLSSISIGIFQHHQTCYSFHGYPSKDCIINIADLLFRFEYDKEALSLCSEFDVLFEHIARSRLKTCLFLGLIEQSRFWAQFTSIEENILVNNLMYSIRIVNTMVKEITRIDIVAIKDVFAEFPFYSFIKSNPKAAVCSKTSELQSFISYYIQPPSSAIRMLSALGFLDPAFSILCSLNQSEEFSNTFIHDFFYPNISKGKTVELVKFLYNRDPGLSFLSPYFIDLIGFLHQRKMYHSLFSFLSMINWLENAAMISIECFNNVGDFRTKMNMLFHAEELLTQSIAIRHGQIESSPDTFPFRPSEMVEEQIITMHKIISVQSKVFSMAFKKKEQYILDSMTKIFDIDSAINTIGVLIDFGYYSLAEEICSTFELSLSDALKDAVIRLSKSSLDIILSFIKKTQSQKTIMKAIFKPLLNNIIQSDKWYYLPIIITTTHDDPRSQCSLFLDYGFISEALDVATRKSCWDFIPIIAYKASQTGNSSVVQFVQEKF